MRIFLSFNSKDLALAETLRAAIVRIEPASRVFLSSVSLGAGFWLPKIDEELKAADALLILIGPNGVGPWQSVEYSAAFDRHCSHRASPSVAIAAAPPDVLSPRMARAIRRSGWGLALARSAHRGAIPREISFWQGSFPLSPYGARTLVFLGSERTCGHFWPIVQHLLSN